MNIDINYSIIYYTCNFNVYEFHWQSFGQGIWYDTRSETRKEARAKLKAMVWEDFFEDNPQLKGTDVKYIESFASGELPTIQEKDR